METQPSPDSACLTYELHFPIKAPASVVWKSLTESVDFWWPDSYRILGPESKIDFDISPGGRGLTEYDADGSFLQWFQVQAVQPADYVIYLVGFLAPDYGGPATTHLRIDLEEEDGTTTLSLVDGFHGAVDDGTEESLSQGWTQVFGQSFKAFAESQADG